tara:strand:- start:3135 stop:3404 length:270 start_codon:yes stop_codon:yes gene_type:complete
MPKKRRKLNPEMEKEISSAKKKVELIAAIINDIEEEEIQGDYIIAFEPVKVCLSSLCSLYDQFGFNEESQNTLKIYRKLILEFEEQYEV